MVRIYITFIAGFILLFCVDQASAQVRPETMRQIESLLQEKEARTPAQQKMDSRLIQAAKERVGQKMAEGITLQPVMVNADKSGNLKVDIDGDVTEALLGKIKSLGGQIIYPSKQFKTVRAIVNLSDVETIAAFAEVRFIQPAVLSRTVGSGNPKQNLSKVTAPLLSHRFSTVSNRSLAERKEKVKKQVEKYMMMLGTGSVNSEGDKTHRANDARNAFGYSGQGIKIGVLSDSYNSGGTAAASIASGNLPGTGNPLGNTTPVTVLQDYVGGEDEGQAMLQIIHDIAPKAQLYFATADVSEAGFANNIIALRTAGCDIIIDDVFYYDEPPFQDGIVAQAVNTVTTAGALYFSSAGNQGSLVKGTSSVFEGDFNSVGSAVFAGATKTGDIHNFGNAVTAINGDIITTPNTKTGTNFYFLFWADALGKSSNDYDLFLISSSGTVKAMSTNTQNGTQNPIEAISTATAWVTGDRLVVFKTSTASARAFSLNAFGGLLTVATNGQTHGHSSAANAFSVAATPAVAAYPNAFIATNKVEYFSSDGPRKMFYNADTTAITANNFLFGTNGGLIRNKPDITAADGVSTSLSKFAPFYGTSAAAPHAGAIAALLKSANPLLTTTQIRNILTSTALDIETPGYDYNSGFGIVQAYQAMQAVNPTPLANISLGTVTTTEGAFSNNNGSVEPGELGKLVVQLNNPSLATATNVTATITTTTAGVTITQGSATYGTITASTSVSNTSAPFTFAVNSSVACGTVITFYMTVNFGGGGSSPQGFLFTVTAGVQAVGTISGILGSTPPAGNNYQSATGIQTGRISRNTASMVPTCSAPFANPGLAIATGARPYDSYTFTNTGAVSQCVSITMASANSAGLFCVAYSSGGFVPSNPSTNFLADGGNSNSPEQYSFTAPAGQSFTIVIHGIDSITNVAGNQVGSAYSLNVSLTNCAAPPACNPILITPTILAKGATGTTYSQTIAATGGSGSGYFTYSLGGGLPTGLSFAGNKISGTPMQAGSFLLSFTAKDPTGCTATIIDTLKIAGNIPTAIVATAGTPQTSNPSIAFATALQAKVTDTANLVLSGVTVVFSAPTSGASGTFANGFITDTVVTDVNGLATALAFTANTSVGSFTVTAAVTGITAPANFILTNTCPATIVTSNADNGPGSLRYIVTTACSGSTITFATSITSIALTSGEISINKAINITGPGANVLTVSGSNLSRIFSISPSNTSTVAISGLTIRDGKARADTTIGGGGIIINSGIVNLTSCVISNNSATQVITYSDGGGIYNQSGAAVTIDHCTIINNITERLGGGIAHWGSAKMTITNSTIAANTATGAVSGAGYGGGIFYNYLTTLANCTVYANTGYGFGGNIERNASTLSIGNTIVAGGILASGAAAANGKDIYISSGGSIISNGYNLVQNIGGYTLSTNNNIQGISPSLFPIANYGGTTPTLLPMSNSPVVDAGDPTLVAASTDQRGLSRKVGSSSDIGAVETNYVANSTNGTPQSTTTSSDFATTLQASVTESGKAIAGDSVMFTAPNTGASGTFSNSSATFTTVTNGSGIAVAPVFTANLTGGTYTVIGSIGTAFLPINFVLTNKASVTFGAITATVVNCTALVQWETLTEYNSKDFVVEYSTDGVFYIPLVTLASQGNSTTKQVYKFLHTSLVHGSNYYRIKQTALNGVVIYSSVVTVANACDNTPIVAYPNPVRNSLTVVLSGTDKQTIGIYDAIGRRVNQYIANGGIQIINTSGWAKGIYTLVVTKNDSNIFTMKVIKY